MTKIIKLKAKNDYNLSKESKNKNNIRNFCI